MNIFRKVTVKTMQRARTRTLVTIIGVILSSAMFCAVTTFAASLRQFLIDECVANSGDYFGAVSELTPEQARELAADERVSQAGLLSYQGFSPWGGIRDYLAVAAADDTFLESMPLPPTEGRLPENSGEILVSSLYLMDLAEEGTILSLGDTLTLDLGWRQALDGTAMSQTGSLLYDEDWAIMEELGETASRSYTIVGITEAGPHFGNWDLPAEYAITCLEETGDGPVSVYFKTKNAADALPLVEEYGPQQKFGGSYWVNQNLLDFYGATKYSSFNRMIGGLVVILALIIMVGAISLIHNAFSISLSERSRQFGLMSSVGATKKQLRKMIFTEAWTVSLIGIPIGVLAGVGGIGVTLYFIRTSLQNIFAGTDAVLRLRFSWAAVLAAALISLVTVLISAWIPARRATKVTAIEAIRQSRDIQVSPKAVKVGRLTHRLFGLEGLLARKYFKCSRKKYRATVVSLVLSVVLFISASSYSMYLTSMFTENFTVHNYDATVYLDGDDFDLYDQIAALPTVNRSSYYAYGAYQEGLTDLDGITPEYREFLDSWDPDLLQNSSVWLDAPQTIYLDDASFLAYLQAEGMDPAPYFDEDAPLPLVINRGSCVTYGNDAEGNYSRMTYTFDFLRSGTDTILLGAPPMVEEPELPPQYGSYYFHSVLNENGSMVFQLVGELEQNGNWIPTVLAEYPIELEKTPLGAKVSAPPFGIDPPETRLQLIYPLSAAPEDVLQDYRIALQGEDPAAMSREVTALLEEAGLGEPYSDYAAQEEANRQLITIINIFSYGFIILISLISVANVFNTISTNVALRRRDFAMLRSVGMTNKGLNRMMNYECLLYGAKALLWGLPLTLPICYAIWKTLSQSVSAPFTLPWGAVAIAVCSVFLVVFITMLYAMSKVKKQGTVDSLKDENL